MSQEVERSPIQVGLVQFKPRKGDVSGNMERIRALVATDGPKHDLLVFPEACLSGYFVEGGVVELALSADQLVERLGEPSEDGPDLVLGFFERWRRGIYNSVAYLTPVGGRYQLLHVHRKLFLPTYGIFEEGRFVEPGRELQAFESRLGRMGMLICEDMWHSLPATILALGGAEILVVVSASPAREFGTGTGRPGNLDRWDLVVTPAAVEHGIFVLVSQLVGSEGGKIFPGGSLAMGPTGTVLGRGELFEEGVTSVALQIADIDRARFESPLLADLQGVLPYLERALDQAQGKAPGSLDQHGEEDTDSNGTAAFADRREKESKEGGDAHGPLPGDLSILDLDLELVERSLVEFIRDEVRGRRGFEKVIVGVSGGVDSAVSLSLAARALGAENVVGIKLPYATSSPESVEHANLILEVTGAESRTIDITSAVDSYIRDVDPDLSPLRRGNLAARIRAITLFDQSASLGALPLGTGNKSERLMGYFTWHADDSPPINPLGDLFKTQVWALAKHLGIPDEIVEKPASADLIRGIHDEDELGIHYHLADPILHWFVSGYRPEELVDRGFSPEDVELVWQRLSSSHWKRELPTVAVLSSTAIGEFYLRPVDY